MQAILHAKKPSTDEDLLFAGGLVASVAKTLHSAKMWSVMSCVSLEVFTLTHGIERTPRGGSVDVSGFVALGLLGL